MSDIEEHLRQRAEAYPDDIFLPLTDEQRKDHPIVICRASAQMGRHQAPFLIEAADRIAELKSQLADTEVELLDAETAAVQSAAKAYRLVAENARLRGTLFKQAAELVKLHRVDAIHVPDGVVRRDSVVDIAIAMKNTAVQQTAPSQVNPASDPG